MSFLFINKALRIDNLKTRTAMSAKISLFVICVEVITYLLLHNLHYCTVKSPFRNITKVINLSHIAWYSTSSSIKNCSKIFTGKHLCWSLASLLKKKLENRCFPLNIAKLLRTPVLKNIWERPFLVF